MLIDVKREDDFVGSQASNYLLAFWMIGSFVEKCLKDVVRTGKVRNGCSDRFRRKSQVFNQATLGYPQKPIGHGPLRYRPGAVTAYWNAGGYPSMSASIALICVSVPAVKAWAKPSRSPAAIISWA